MPVPEFILIHAPLVGPFTWQLVAGELANKGLRAVVPELTRAAGKEIPYWEQHVKAVVEALQTVPRSQPLILVAHSGAGPLLPAVRQKTGRPVSAYIFVDAMLPVSGKSSLDLFEDKEAVAQFRQSAKDGFLPVWTDEDLREVIPDDAVRSRFTRELAPLPVQVYEEPLPVFEGWPDAPCAYLRFGSNPAYDAASQQAQSAGYRYLQIEGQHFHMLVEPGAVAQALVDLVQQMGIHLRTNMEEQ